MLPGASKEVRQVLHQTAMIERVRELCQQDERVYDTTIAQAGLATAPLDITKLADRLTQLSQSSHETGGSN